MANKQPKTKAPLKTKPKPKVAKKVSVKTQLPTDTSSVSEDEIRQRAYLKWIAETNGQPVSEDRSKQYWLEAEQEVIQSNN